MSRLSLGSKIKLNNGVEIPILGLGTWQAYGKEVKDAVKYALEIGYRHIDTAFFYGNEKEIGDAIREFGISREEIFITTKLWNDSHGFKNAQKAFKKSLKNLKLDYIDLFLIHWPVSRRRIETWKALEEIYKEGLVRSIGVSNYMINHLEELLPNAEIIPQINQVEITPYIYRKSLIDFCHKNEIQVEAYSPLTRTKKFSDPKLKSIAEKYGKTSAQILIRWGLQHNLIEIPKSTNKDRIKENADVFDFEISKDDMQILDSLNENFSVIVWDPNSDMFK
ncbi:MAG: aldo/keto reductase [Promethearchaeota archaeon]